MAEYRPTTYTFGPLERGGFIMGLRIPQAVGMVLAGALGLGFLKVGGIAGLLLAVSTVALAGLLFFRSVRGRTLEEWAPLAVRFLVGRVSARHRFRAQLGQVGHVVSVPDGGMDPEAPGEPASVPAELAGLEYLEGALTRFDGARMGVIADRQAKTFTATLQCQGHAFALIDPAEREQRLADYGGVLAALARDGSPVRRIAWTERTLPADSDAMAKYLIDELRPDASIDEPSLSVQSYLQLLNRAGDVAEDHELMVSIQIDAQSAGARRAVKRQGGGDLGALAVMASEVEQVRDLLEGAGITVVGVHTRRSLAAVIRNGYDPFTRQQRQRTGARAANGREEQNPATAGPMARDEAWGHIACDGALHSTLWVADWPRIDVRALFLQPLLMQSRATRAVTMVMDLEGPEKATRAVELAAIEADSDKEMRRRIRQRATSRQRKKEASIERREEELAEGHAQVRFAAFVTVSAPVGPNGEDELEAAVSRVELRAKTSMLRLERMWGQQAEAMTFTLPLGRGLR